MTGQKDKTEQALFDLKETEIVCEINRRSARRIAKRTCWHWESTEAFHWNGHVAEQSWLNVACKYLFELKGENFTLAHSLFFLYCKHFTSKTLFAEVSLDKKSVIVRWIYACNHTGSRGKSILKTLHLRIIQSKEWWWWNHTNHRTKPSEFCTV